jgi:hypothetical protein
MQPEQALVVCGERASMQGAQTRWASSLPEINLPGEQIQVLRCVVDAILLFFQFFYETIHSWSVGLCSLGKRG